MVNQTCYEKASSYVTSAGSHFHKPLDNGSEPAWIHAASHFLEDVQILCLMRFFQSRLSRIAIASQSHHSRITVASCILQYLARGGFVQKACKYIPKVALFGRAPSAVKYMTSGM